MSPKNIAFSVIGVGMLAILFFVIRGPAQRTVPPNPDPNIDISDIWATYTDVAHGFSISYPKDATIEKENFEGFLARTKTGAIGIRLPENLFTGTNLGEAGVFIGVNKDADAVSNCTKIVDSEEQVAGTAKLDTTSFTVFNAVGVGAGNTYESKIYRAVHAGACYEIVELLHSGNIYNYTPGTVKEFDKAKFLDVLEGITKTFQFTIQTSGIEGHVTLGPTCPVERIPPDPNCAPKPYKTNIAISNFGSSAILKTIATDADGAFTVELPPGSYELTPKSGSVFPHCSPMTIEVQPNTLAEAHLSCDTGIR